MSEPRDRGLRRHGDPDPSQWDEAKAVTGRPNDLGQIEPKPALPNSTLASRGKGAAKQVEKSEAEDKAVKAAEKPKPRARKAT